MTENKTQSNDSQSTGVSRRDIFHILGSVPAMAAVTAGSALSADPRAWGRRFRHSSGLRAESLR